MQVIEVTPVLDTSQYASADVLFVPIIVSAYAIGKARKLQSIVVVDQADQAQAMDLVFTAGSVALGTINQAVSITDADALKIIGTVNIATTDYCDTVNNQVATKRGVELIIQPDTDLYLAGILRSGTPTYAASSLRIRLGFEDQAK